MNKHMLLVMVMLALLSTHAHSHGIWFAERSSQLALVYGEGADDLDTVARKHKINDVSGYDHNWREINTELTVAGPLLTLTPLDQVFAVTAVLDNGLWSKTSDGKWHPKGRDAVPNAVLSEHTFKYGVHLRGELTPVPAMSTQRLQLQPVGKQFSNQKGDEVTLRVLFDGKPIKGGVVVRDFVNDPDATPLVSDDEGQVTFALQNQGLNVVAVIYEQLTPKSKIIDKVEHLATLSFVLPHAAE